jgi:DNA polymerase III delta subunit
MTTAVLLVAGAGDAGPGDRDEMLRRAYAALEEAGVDGIDRLDVPGRGISTDESESVLRPEVAGLVPALQSGSLFGGRRGWLVVDAQNLLKGEAEVIAELVAGLEAGTAVVCFVSAGALPAPLGRVVERTGEKVTVKKLRERDAAEWLGGAARRRRVTLTAGAGAALVQRFGSDIASLGQALDQLATLEGAVTETEVAARFRNRPDEPMWHYADAVGEGDTGAALRRLTDFLAHGHPLQLLAFLESDLRRRAMALAAPDQATFAEWAGGSMAHFPLQKAWRARARVSPERLHRALDALARADLWIKTMPEATHRLTMERLTVALCQWYGGRGARRV